MKLLRKVYNAPIAPVADRQVRVVISTDAVDRDGEIIVNAGISTAAYMASGAGTVLWNHNPNMPIAKCVEISLVGNETTALVEFPPAGLDAESDLYYGKIKFGSVSGVSIGFLPMDAEPLDKGNPRKGPQKYLSCELMEFSFTPVQSNRGAMVVERSARHELENWKVGASRNLPVVDDSEWDGEAIEKAILEQADFDSDSPDTTFARKGFLAYDAGNADFRDSYIAPFAKMVDGRLSVTKSGLKAASSWLKTASLPEDVTAKARAVIEHYEAKMTNKTAPKSILKAGTPIKVKGLYQVAELASIFMNLAWLQDSVEWEAAYEEDGSQLPAQLAAIMHSVADALLAMTAEEVAEVLADLSPQDNGDVAKGICAAGAKPIVKAIIAAHLKAGRKLSADSITTLQEACKAIKGGHDMISGMLDDGSADTAGTEEKSAAADRVKAADLARQKRMRDVEVLRLSAV
jgi:hypothetical protein